MIEGNLYLLIVKSALCYFVISNYIPVLFANGFVWQLLCPLNTLIFEIEIQKYTSIKLSRVVHV